MKYLIVALMWVGFGIIHSLLINQKFTNWAKGVMGRYFAFYRLGYNILSLILFIVFMYVTKTLDSELILKFVPPWTILQKILLVSSGIVIFWSFLSYDFLEFLGIRQLINFGNEKDYYFPKTITKKGLLGIVRHPLYLATLVFFWSLNSTRVDIVTHLVFTIYIIFGIRLEEYKLVKEFGAAYTQYQKEVPALIPFTKKRIMN